MDPVAALAVASAFLLYGLLSGRVQRSVLTGPMLFAAFGLVMGPAVLNVVPLAINDAAFHVLAEVTLILVLFTDATAVDLRRLRRDHNLILEEAEVAGAHEIVAVTAATVALSILAHGLTAWPLAHFYGARAAAMGVCEENQPVSEEPFSTVRAGAPG